MFVQHEGLMRMLSDLWEDHEVRIDEVYPPFPLPRIDGTEDIIVSTLHHRDLPLHSVEKPIIVYATDPFLTVYRDMILENPDRYYVVGAENCYPESWFVPVKEWIPFAIKPERYGMYEGTKNKVLVVNRRANARFLECSRGTTLDDFLDGLDWDLARTPDKDELIKMYREYKVLFYFSNSPYALVMFEAMQVGIPIVAYTHNQIEELYPDKNPIKKYLPTHLTNKQDIHDALNGFLNNDPIVSNYNFIPFTEIKQKWNNLFERLCEHTTI